MFFDNFRPSPAATIVVTPAPTTAAAQVNLPTNGETLELNNTGTVTVFVEFGLKNAAAATVPTATPGSYPIQPGQCKLVTRPKFGGTIAGMDGVGADVVSTITASGTGALSISAGNGN